MNDEQRREAMPPIPFENLKRARTSEDVMVKYWVLADLVEAVDAAHELTTWIAAGDGNDAAAGLKRLETALAKFDFKEVVG